MRKGKGGRKAKLTQELYDCLISSIRQGLTLKAAARNACIGYSTILRYRAKGAKAVLLGESNEYSKLTTDIDGEYTRFWKKKYEMEMLNINKNDYRWHRGPIITTKTQTKLNQKKRYLEAKARDFVICNCQKATLEK